ncbi:ABC transporter substrate-binding protein [Effusibacillus dendaii]|uniref:Putative binding protein YtlA n=1 Tax=Effusibacillus dendaii TaxID=2743772 RepID=A0A7I8D4P4_9BACL|nr:ABC transporter substrate-binding protein [Effusibacillus dendaii]BCJ85045.1 putative binding protein YtlA [Effusibacillus dendaii]
MKWKSFAGLVLAGILLFSVGCGGTKQTSNTPSDSNPAANSTKVRVSEVIRSVFYAPQYVALQKGFFKEQGLDVELTTAWGGDKVMTALLSDQTDIGLVGAETTIFVNQQGSPDPVVNFAQVTQRDGSFLVARQKIDKFDWSLLKGKSLIGSRSGSMPEMVSEFVQRKHQINPKTDNQIIQNISFDTQTSAFASGTGDFYQAFEPAASILEKQGQGYVVAYFGEDSGKLPYTVFMAKQTYMQKNAETIQKFTNAVQKAQNWIQSASGAEIADMIAAYFPDVRKDILTMVADRYKKADAWAKDPIIDKEEWDNLQTIIQQAGELKAAAPYDKLVNTTFAEKAKQLVK